jgi:hypothetical protein
MKWYEIRRTFPNQWLIIEALQAHTTSDNKREPDKIEVIERCADSISALQRYRHLHRVYPSREFYFVHTSREGLDIRERAWTGIRRGDEAISKV